MDCPACKKGVADDAVFCPHCGVGLVGASACHACGALLAPWEARCPRCEAARPAAGGVPASDDIPGPADGPASGQLSGPASTPSHETGHAAAGNVPPASEAAPGEEAAVSGYGLSPPVVAGVAAAVLACAAALYLLSTPRAPAPSPMPPAPAAPRALPGTPRPLAPLPLAPLPLAPLPVAPLPQAADPAPSAPLEPPLDAAEPTGAGPQPEKMASGASATPPPRLPQAGCKRAARATGRPSVQAARAIPRPPAKPAARKAVAPRKPPVRAHSAKAADWHAAIRARLAECARKSFLEYIVCREKARWKYCDPHRWDRVPECRLNARPGQIRAQADR